MESNSAHTSSEIERDIQRPKEVIIAKPQNYQKRQLQGWNMRNGAVYLEKAHMTTFPRGPLGV